MKLKMLWKALPRTAQTQMLVFLAVSNIIGGLAWAVRRGGGGSWNLNVHHTMH